MEQLTTVQPEVVLPEQDSGFWQKVKHLGFAALGRNQDGTQKEKSVRRIADEVPEFLELGPQRPGGDPHFLAPNVDGPLLENKQYQRALKAIGKMELPSETIDRCRRQ